MLFNRRILPNILYLIVWLVLVTGLVTAQDAAPDPNCPGAPLPRLIINTYGRVLPGDANNVREQPARGTALVGAIPGGAEFTVLEGPVCSDGLNWWRVSTADVSGWTVEGSGVEYWVEPVPQVATPTPEPQPWIFPYRDPEIRISNPIVAGATARVQTISYDPLPFYANPGDATPAGEFPVNTLVVLLEEMPGGWWKVENEQGVQGWVREAIALNANGTGLTPTLAPICPYAVGRVLFVAYDTKSPEQTIGDDLYTAEADGAHICNLSYGLPRSVGKYDWSPDGSWVAISGVLTGSCGFICDGELYIVRADGSEMRRLTFDQNSGDLQWSPDGQWIAVRANGNDPNTAAIRLISPDGSVDRILYAAAGLENFLWSPDGDKLAAIDITRDGIYLVLIDIESETPQRLLNVGRATSMDWSPDGQFLLMATEIEGEHVLIEIDTMTGSYQELMDYPRTAGATYSPDGTRIGFWEIELDRARRVKILDRATGEIRSLVSLPGLNRPGISWTPDSEALLVYSNGVLQVNATTGALRSIFVGQDGSLSLPPMIQPQRTTE